MATKFYLNNSAAPYTPATFKGAWDGTGFAVTQRLGVDKTLGGAVAGIVVVGGAVSNWDGAGYRGVSDTLAAQTIAGTFNVLMGATAPGTADCTFHLHLYVTQGDSDLVRGTLLADYVETLANEMPAGTFNGHGLASAQTLTPVTTTAGDRLVLEIGGRFNIANSSGESCTIYRGGGTGSSDMTLGGYELSQAGYVTFSATLVFGPAAPAATPRSQAIMVS